MYRENRKESTNQYSAAEDPFEDSIWVYDETEESEAYIPRRAPRMRDDGGFPDGWWDGPSDRIFDSEFFAENPTKCFRLVSATAGDRRRAGLGDLPPGERGLRISRLQGFGANTWPVHIVFDWPTARCSELNEANNERLHDLWWALEDVGYAICDSAERRP